MARPGRVSVLLGVDLGDRRIGIAAADTESRIVTPLATLARRSPELDAAAIVRLREDHGAAELVVGLPLDADGSAGEQARRTLDWVAAVRPLVGLPIGLRDEHDTSRLAEARLGRPPRGRSGGPPSAHARRSRRARLDREAAALILQRELDARATTGSTR
jgi:putative Holliday junction resolvase